MNVLADHFVADRHFGQQRLAPMSVSAPAAHPEAGAQRHEFGIALDVGHEIEHLLRPVADATLVAKRRHVSALRRTFRGADYGFCAGAAGAAGAFDCP